MLRAQRRLFVRLGGGGGPDAASTHYEHGVTGNGFPHDLQAVTDRKCIPATPSSIERANFLCSGAKKEQTLFSGHLYFYHEIECFLFQLLRFKCVL
jgi:hypothetical protein